MEDEEMMTREKMAELLAPFLDEEMLSEEQYLQIEKYLRLLLLWNSKINLSSVREPENILQRHFGESIFAARKIVGKDETIRLMDIGSGAGFPGLPCKIVRPRSEVALVEAKAKRATFLREVIRGLQLSGITVHEGRASEYTQAADVVAMRAVERTERIIPMAMSHVSAGGRLVLMVTAKQIDAIAGILGLRPESVIHLPLSRDGVVACWRSL